MTLETPRELLEAISSPHIDAPRIPRELLEATTKLTQSSLIRDARHISRTQQLLQSPSSIHQSRSSTIILNNSNTLVPNTPPPSSAPTPLPLHSFPLNRRPQKLSPPPLLHHC